MSKNNLLNEGTVRRFMKLANVDTLTDTFVERLSESVQEETVEEGTVDEASCTGARDDMPHGDKPMEEMYGMQPGDRDEDMDEPPMGAEEPEVEVDVEDEGDAPVGDSAQVRTFVTTVLDAMEQGLAALGMEDMLQVTDEDEEEEMMPAADEPEEAMMEEAEEALEEETLEEETVEEVAHGDGGDDGKKTMEETIEEVNVVEDEDLINEVAKRVTARLVKSLAARKNS